MESGFRVIVVGGGHAGIEAAWAAANRLGGIGSVALLSIDRSKVGVMSCNPAIGGLAKGQLVREIDALGGLMGLVADASGIQFKVLNTSKGQAVHGPRCQSDKHAYARVARAMIESRPEIQIVEGLVEGLISDARDDESMPKRIRGVQVRGEHGLVDLYADSVVVTTGTFMRGLMHTGQTQTSGGRAGEEAAVGISGSLKDLGFELGRLKTGTPPRLRLDSIDWDALPIERGDAEPVPFSELTPGGWSIGEVHCDRFPLLEQVTCRQSRTSEASHRLIRENLDRAPMFSGQIESAGPRYCPSIEDKVVRFAERESHGVFLEPESHESDWVYCNGISTSLPCDIQDEIVHQMPGCADAEILQYGYAVEYDMVHPHQIRTSCEARGIRGLFLAGQINGTSGYEEAAAQGLVAGINAAMLCEMGDAAYEPFSLGRDQAYIGVLLDDLVTKTPREPYRMFTSRAEHRLLLRADNAPDRLTPIGEELGLLSNTELGRARLERFRVRQASLVLGRRLMDEIRDGHKSLSDRVLEPGFAVEDLVELLEPKLGAQERGVWITLHADRRYEPYIERQKNEIRRSADLEHRPLPDWLDYASLTSMRSEARAALAHFRPATFGQASRLEGVTPSDITLLSVLVKRARSARASLG